MTTSDRDPTDTGRDAELPPFSRWLNGWFMFYVRRYLRRHFHAVRVLQEAAGGGVPDLRGEPVLIYTNHPGWWDPLIFLFVGEALYPDRMSYGPIDARALGKYRFLERIGFIGIEPGTWRGSARFLRMARAAARRSDVIFWTTAQGEFADPRDRPVEIRPGVGHAVAAARGGVAAASGGVAAASGGVVVPMAVEYPFWNERFPEALVAFGPTLRPPDGPGRSADEWTRILARELEATQDRLAAAARRRDAAAFRTLLSGRVGVGFVYDSVRRVRAWFRGERFDAAHGGSDS